MKEKESLYTQLINIDTDEEGNVITIDEIVENNEEKKKLMQKFLTAMKKSSIDCILITKKKKSVCFHCKME